MSGWRSAVVGAVIGVVVYFAALQLVVLTTGGAPSAAVLLVGMLGTAALVGSGVLAGVRWPSAAMVGASVIAVLVALSFLVFEGFGHTRAALTPGTLLRYGAAVPLPAAIAAATATAAAFRWRTRKDRPQR